MSAHGAVLAHSSNVDIEDKVAGVLLGTAQGDSLGVPHEGLHPRRIHRRLADQGLSHGMIFGRGVISDDTEQAGMLARALAESDGELEPFTRSFVRQFKRWILSMGIRNYEFRARVRCAWLNKYDSLGAYRYSAGYERGVSGFIVHTVPAVLFVS